MLTLSLIILNIQMIILIINWHYLSRRRMERGCANASTPTLSILIPARNERLHLPHLLEALPSNRYEGVEVWVCDDQSDDGTVEWLQQSAATYGVRWFRGQPLEAGWTGKNWACFQLAKRARNEWLVFLDADVMPHPDFIDALRAAFSVHHEAMLLTAIPTLKASGLLTGLLKVMVPFCVFTLLPLPLAEKAPNPAFAFANGQMLAIRQNDYQRLQPHQHLRTAILEDVGFAALVKQAGGRVVILDARRWLQVCMYRTLREAIDGFAKNAVAICRGVFRALVVMVLFVWVYLVPLMQLLLLSDRPIVAWIALLESAVLFGVSALLAGMPGWYGLFYPISVMLGLWTLGKSIRWYSRGAVQWKDRWYSMRVIGSR